MKNSVYHLILGELTCKYKKEDTMVRDAIYFMWKVIKQWNTSFFLFCPEDIHKLIMVMADWFKFACALGHTRSELKGCNLQEDIMDCVEQNILDSFSILLFYWCEYVS